MTIQKENGHATLFVEGRIDTYNAPQFAEEMGKALDGVTDLTLDFSRLSYISSSGLRAVMLAVKTMARQGEMRIVGVNDVVYEILETTGFTGMCDVDRAVSPEKNTRG